MWKYLQVRSLKRYNWYYSFIKDILYPHWILVPAFSERFLMASTALGLNHQPSLSINVWLTWGQLCLSHRHALLCKGTIRKLLKRVKICIPWELLIYEEFPYSEPTQNDKTSVSIFSQNNSYILHHSPFSIQDNANEIISWKKAKILCAFHIWTYRGTADRGSFWQCFSWRKHPGTWDHHTVKAQSAPDSFQMNEYIC